MQIGSYGVREAETQRPNPFRLSSLAISWASPLHYDSAGESPKKETQMENRERDKMSRNTESTSAGDVNRNTSSQIGKNKSDSSADFGQKIGRSENLNEPGSRGRNSSGSSGYDSSSSSRSSGSSSMGSEPRNSNSDKWSDDSSSSGSRH